MWKRLSRSELLSTFFPTWVWQGREWAKWRVPKYDRYYWINAYSSPVINSFYPFSIISSSFAVLTNLDSAFRLLLVTKAFHIILGYVGWWNLVCYWSEPIVATFGAITFTLAGYNWKQQPCFQYTVAWFPWLLLGIAENNTWMAGISFGMILLAGYYPIGLQISLVAILATIVWLKSPLWIVVGSLIGLPQLIPFLRYLPKTIRAHKHDSLGTVPWWHVASLIAPRPFRWNISGVGYWEMSYYIGIIPLLTIWYTTSKAWILVVLAYTLMIGLFASRLPRIPARWSYTFQFGLIWCAVSGLSNLNLPKEAIIALILVQLADLLLNNLPLAITAPYSELWNRPSHAFNTKLTRYLKENLHEKERVSGLPYPLFTGHVNRLLTLGYSGGMQLLLMARFRGDRNPNGSGEHDWFKQNKDTTRLDEYRVKFAYTRKRIDWERTPVKHLYRNPRLS